MIATIVLVLVTYTCSQSNASGSNKTTVKNIPANVSYYEIKSGGYTECSKRAPDNHAKPSRTCHDAFELLRELGDVAKASMISFPIGFCSKDKPEIDYEGLSNRTANLISPWLKRHITKPIKQQTYTQWKKSNKKDKEEAVEPYSVFKTLSIRKARAAFSLTLKNALIDRIPWKILCPNKSERKLKVSTGSNDFNVFDILVRGNNVIFRYAPCSCHESYWYFKKIKGIWICYKVYYTDF